jgi:hypothetical protein
MLFTQKTKTIPIDRYQVTDNYDPKGALSFSREQAPPAFLAVMTEIQDRIADTSLLVSTMATAKEPGWLAHASGQLNALLELWDTLEQRRAEASRLE